MAKKSQSRKKRKQRKPNVPVYAVPTKENAEHTPQPAPVTASAPAKAAPVASAAAEEIDWAKEYPYFAPDMKRLGIVVLLMVVLLLALNFLFIYVL